MYLNTCKKTDMMNWSGYGCGVCLAYVELDYSGDSKIAIAADKFPVLYVSYICGVCYLCMGGALSVAVFFSVEW